MAYWVVQHDLASFEDRPDAIGMEKAKADRDKNFRLIKKDDKIIYYATGGLTLGLYLVCSDWQDFRSWGPSRRGPHKGYDIKPIFPKVAKNLKLADFGIKSTRGRTAISLGQQQYKEILARLLGMPEPTDHEGTLALFAKIHEGLGFPQLLKVQSPYPDVVALDSERKEVRIEIEFQSASFENEHSGREDECDLIVCWEDTWGQAARKPIRAMKNLLF